MLLLKRLIPQMIVIKMIVVKMTFPRKQISFLLSCHSITILANFEKKIITVIKYL